MLVPLLKNYWKSCLYLVISAFFIGCNIDSDRSKPMNVIIILTDDLGYGDIGCYGNPSIHTPNLDRMAREGMKFTQFYSVAPVCTPSRASLLTGSYPKRVGLHNHVLFPYSNKGLHPDEYTMAEMFRDKGYTTACFGKWHLGHHKAFLPLQQGFEEFWGIPFSNDMSKKEQELLGDRGIKGYPHILPVLNGNDTISVEPDQAGFTRTITEKALKFIEENSARPFFLYLPHPMPHIPIYASDAFKGSSLRGKYGDTIEELDWGMGQILDHLKRLGIDGHTMVFFTSDNGPWLQYKLEGGSSGPLRGGKGTVWEGGLRVPFIAWGPGNIPSASLNLSPATFMDLMPTFAEILRADSLESRWDGSSILGSLITESQPEQREFEMNYYTRDGELAGIRQNNWKLLTIGDSTYLFDLEKDISEEYNLSSKLPELSLELKQRMRLLDEEIIQLSRPVGIHIE